MNEPKQEKSLSKSAPRGIRLLDFPDDILRHITSFYERNEILGLITACKRIYTMPFMGYVDHKSKYIQVVIVLDTTGSMATCIENLKPSILMILVKAKEEYPEYTVLFSIVEYGDVESCFDVETEHVKGQNKVAELTYRPGSHFISIQCPLRVFDKIHRMLSDLQLRGGGGPEAMDQAIIHLEKEFSSSWVGCRQPYSPSVDYVIFLGDVVGHNMGNDKQELFLDFFGQHGQSKDWFAPLKKLYKKNVVLIHLGLTTNVCSEPAVHQHFGRIVASLGGYSFNIREGDVFDIPRIVIDLMKPELATRAIIQQAHKETVNKTYGASKQEIKKAILAKLDESKSLVQSANFDQSVMNKGSPEMEKKIQACDTLEDLEKHSFMPTRETLVLLARSRYGGFTNVGEIDEEAAYIRKKRKLSSSSSSGAHPMLPNAQASAPADLFGMPMGPPALSRQLTCAAPSRRSSYMPPVQAFARNFSTPDRNPSRSNEAKKTDVKSVSFAPALGTVDEDLPPMPLGLPPMPLGLNIPMPAPIQHHNQIIQINFGLVRMQTQAYEPDFDDDSDEDVDAHPLVNPDVLPIFRDSPWRELMQDDAKIKMFKSGSKAPVPSRLQIGLARPHHVFRMPIGKLERDIRKDDLKVAREKLISSQPFQKPIIDAGSFEKHCENLNPQKENMQIAIAASLAPAIAAPFAAPAIAAPAIAAPFAAPAIAAPAIAAPFAAMPPTAPTLERARSVFIPGAPSLHRSMTSVDSTNSQTMRNLNSQFE